MLIHTCSLAYLKAWDVEFLAQTFASIGKAKAQMTFVYVRPDDSPAWHIQAYIVVFICVNASEVRLLRLF
jgi:hypothetical protein